jgi:hypothetical protein
MIYKTVIVINVIAAMGIAREDAHLVIIHVTRRAVIHVTALVMVIQDAHVTALVMVIQDAHVIMLAIVIHTVVVI